MLDKQIEDLERFAENDNYEIALMNRGGASTAYHTASLLIDRKKNFVMMMCREISKMSSQIIVLHQLGFLQRNSFRFQKSFEEIECEISGIKCYLDKWKLNYLEIPYLQRASHSRIAVKYIRNLCVRTDHADKRLT